MSYRLAGTVIRNLKNRFPATGAVYRPVENTHNVTTGKVARNYSIHIIKKMVLMPFIAAKEFVYDSAYNKAAPGMSYGAHFTTNSRTCIIDARDISISINEYDHLVIDGARYEIQKVETPETNQLNSYFLTIKAVVGAQMYTEDVQALINSGWVGRQLTIFALEKLALEVRFTVFGGTVPALFQAAPICGKNFADALKMMFVSGTITPSTAIASEYKEYGINGGIDNADIVTDSGLTYDYGNPVTFIAGGVVLTGPQETALDTAVTNFNTILGRVQ